jgi:hypothetical protein
MTYLVAEAIERYLATEEPVSDDQLKAISATAHGRASDPRVAA